MQKLYFLRFNIRKFYLFSAEYKFDQSSRQRQHFHWLSNRKYMIMINFSLELLYQS